MFQPNDAKTSAKWEELFLKYPEQLMRKVEKLVKEHKVFKLTDEFYVVDGNHGRYEVTKDENGQFKCECRGFSLRNPPICSHVIAVLVVRSCREISVQ